MPPYDPFHGHGSRGRWWTPDPLDPRPAVDRYGRPLPRGAVDPYGRPLHAVDEHGRPIDRFGRPLQRGPVEVAPPEEAARARGPEPPDDAAPRLEAELAERERAIGELTEKLAQRDRELEGVRARLEREARREIERAVRDRLGAWLGALDDLDRAIAAGRASGGSPLLDGVELVRANLLSRLAEQGVRRVEPVGERFDPAVHEAVARVAVAAPADDGAVVETIQPGYHIGDEVIRPARVAVGYLAG